MGAGGGLIGADLATAAFGRALRSASHATLLGRGCAKRLKRSRVGKLCDYPQAICTTAHRLSRSASHAMYGQSTS